MWVVVIVDTVITCTFIMVTWISRTLDIVFCVNTCYTEHCHFMNMYHHYTNTVTMTLLFFVHVPLIHGYTISQDTVISYICIIATWMLCTQLYHVHTSLLHRFTDIHVLIVSVFLFHGSLFILHGLLLHGYYYISVTWLFPVTDIDIPVTGHMSWLYAMYETKCHMDLSHGGYL